MMVYVRRLRMMEWLCSALVLATGLHLLAFPASFYRPSMSGLASMFSYQAWTFSLISIGMARCIALLVNGRWPEGTPQIRGLGAVFGTAVFGLLAGGFAQATEGLAPSPAVTVYIVLMIADIISSAFAMSDFLYARRARK
jgi:hypothetical protein